MRQVVELKKLAKDWVIKVRVQKVLEMEERQTYHKEVVAQQTKEKVAAVVHQTKEKVAAVVQMLETKRNSYFFSLSSA